MRLLIAEFHHLGDAVLSLPFLRGALHAGHEIEVWCRPSALPIFQAINAPEAPQDSLKIFTWSPPWHEETPKKNNLSSLLSYFSLIHRWRQRHYDAAITVWADARLAALFTLAGIPRRLGFPMTPTNYYGSQVPWRAQRLRQGQRLQNWLPRILFCPLLTSPLHRNSPRQHHLQAWQQLAEALDFTLHRSTPWLISPSTFIPHPSSFPPPPSLLIHPGARLTCKRWPMEKFREVAIRFHQIAPDWQIQVLQDPGEEPANWHLPTVSEQDTPNLPALIQALSKASLILCHDSLAAHLGVALGRPVLAIFGSGDPEIYAPGGQYEAVIQAKGSCPYHPCLELCRQPSYLCLEAISVEDVLKRLQKMLQAPSIVVP